MIVLLFNLDNHIAVQGTWEVMWLLWISVSARFFCVNKLFCILQGLLHTCHSFSSDTPTSSRLESIFIILYCSLQLMLFILDIFLSIKCYHCGPYWKYLNRQKFRFIFKKSQFAQVVWHFSHSCPRFHISSVCTLFSCSVNRLNYYGWGFSWS